MLATADTPALLPLVPSTLTPLLQSTSVLRGNLPLSPTRPRPAAAYALGFLNCDDISARCMLSIFQFFATKTDASALRMLNGRHSTAAASAVVA